MRILVIVCVSDRSELELIKGLKKSGADVEVICDPRETKTAELEDLGIKCEKINIKHRFDFNTIRRIKALLNSKPFDVVYAPTSRGLSTTLIASRNKTLPIISYRGTMGHLSKLDPAAHLSHLNPRVNSIVCNCDAVKEYLLTKGIPEHKLPVIFKGHDPSWYEIDSSTTREELGVPETCLLIGCLANIRPIKGVSDLVKALNRVCVDVNSHLLLIGDNKDRSIVPLVKKLGLTERVHFLGFREDALNIISQCDISVMPSRDREGVPRAIVESMFRDVPAVVSNVGGLPELVQHEKTGLVYPAGDSDTLAEAIRKLARNAKLREEYAANAKSWVHSSLSIEQYVSAYLQLFENSISMKAAAKNS